MVDARWNLPIHNSGYFGRVYTQLTANDTVALILDVTQAKLALGQFSLKLVRAQTFQNGANMRHVFLFAGAIHEDVI